MVIIQEVIKGMEEIITVLIEDAITGIKVMIGIGLDHMKGRIEIGEIIGVQATVGPGQVLKQIQIGI